MVNACLKLIVFSPSLSQLYYSFEKCFLLVPESHWQGKEEAHLSACRAAQGILSAHTGTWRSTLCMLEVVILPVSKVGPCWNIVLQWVGWRTRQSFPR